MFVLFNLYTHIIICQAFFTNVSFYSLWNMGVKFKPSIGLTLPTEMNKSFFHTGLLKSNCHIIRVITRFTFCYFDNVAIFLQKCCFDLCHDFPFQIEIPPVMLVFLFKVGYFCLYFGHSWIHFNIVVLRGSLDEYKVHVHKVSWSHKEQNQRIHRKHHHAYTLLEFLYRQPKWQLSLDCWK